eukprot:scaffold2879_cov128-Skeletonema_dohrnii-CCMP3373.AAC.1
MVSITRAIHLLPRPIAEEPGLCGQCLCGAFAGKPTNGTPLNQRQPSLTQGPTVTQSNSTPILANSFSHHHHLHFFKMAMTI